MSPGVTDVPSMNPGVTDVPRCDGCTYGWWEGVPTGGGRVYLRVVYIAVINTGGERWCSAEYSSFHTGGERWCSADTSLFQHRRRAMMLRRVLSLLPSLGEIGRLGPSSIQSFLLSSLGEMAVRRICSFLTLISHRGAGDGHHSAQHS